jgi:hypothetical protein
VSEEKSRDVSMFVVLDMSKLDTRNTSYVQTTSALFAPIVTSAKQAWKGKTMYSNILDIADLLHLLPLCVSKSERSGQQCFIPLPYVCGSCLHHPFLRIPSTKIQSARKAAMVTRQVIVVVYRETCAVNAARSNRVASFPDGFEHG